MTVFKTKFFSQKRCRVKRHDVINVEVTYIFSAKFFHVGHMVPLNTSDKFDVILVFRKKIVSLDCNNTNTGG